MISSRTASETYEYIENSKNKKKAIKQLAKERGVSLDTVKRYYRYGATLSDTPAQQIIPKIQKTKKDKYLDKLQDFPEEVLRAFVKTGTDIPKRHPLQKISIPKKTFKMGFFTDPHMGSMFFREDWWHAMIDDFNQQNVDLVVCSGDITDGGYFSRKGHIFELKYLGYKAQRDYAVDMLSYIKQPFYTISGNHDLTYVKDVDADIVEEICKALPNASYVGRDIGDLHVNGVIIRLFHGGGGSAYSMGYRCQKIIEAIPGGDKPHLLLVGHTHKSFYMPAYRNIECFEGGAMCEQSDWMRNTLKGNHTGYWTIEVEHDKNGIQAVSGRFRPFFLEPLVKNSVHV